MFEKHWKSILKSLKQKCTDSRRAVDNDGDGEPTTSRRAARKNSLLDKIDNLQKRIETDLGVESRDGHENEEQDDENDEGDEEIEEADKSSEDEHVDQ